MGRRRTKSDRQNQIGGDARAGVLSSRADLGHDESVVARLCRHRTLLAVALIVVAVVAAYSNSLGVPFIFDDKTSIPQNPTIRHLWPIGPMFHPPSSGQAVQRRPVVNVSLAINYAISGDAVWSYHAGNLLAHLLTAFLLFSVLRHTFESPRLQERWGEIAWPLALVIALLWAVHPLLTEAVTYIVQRTEVLAGLFYLCTIYCVIRCHLASRRIAWRWGVAAVIACGLGMGSKESAVSAPLVAALYDRIFLSSSWREVFRRRRWLYVGLAATWGVTLAMLPHGQEGTSILGKGGQSLEYAMAQCGVIMHYLRLCFWPDPLVVDYGFYRPEPFSQTAPWVLFMAALLVATLVALRYRPGFGFLGVVFFAVLAPSSSFVPLFQQVAAEKRMYLPLAAVLTAAITGLVVVGRWFRGSVHPARQADRSPRDRGDSRISRWAWAAIAAATTVLLATLTFHRNADYQSDVAIWQDAVRKLPNNDRAHNNLGMALAGVGLFEQAANEFEIAMKIRPNDGELHNNLGMALASLGLHDRAIAEFRTSIQLDNDKAQVHSNLGSALASVGQIDEAMEHFKKALELDSGLAEVHHNIGLTLANQGHFDEAISQYREALAIDAASAKSLKQLARALATCPVDALRNGPEAVALAERAVAITGGGDPVSLDILAAAYAEAGRFPEAVQAARQAAEIARRLNRPAMVETAERKCRLYEAGKPFHEPFPASHP